MRRLLALVAVALGCNIGNAYTTTIDFEDLAVDPTFAGGGDRISDGFVIDSSGDHSHVDGGAGIWGTSNGTTFMVFDFTI